MQCRNEGCKGIFGIILIHNQARIQASFWAAGRQGWQSSQEILGHTEVTQVMLVGHTLCWQQEWPNSEAREPGDSHWPEFWRINGLLHRYIQTTHD